MKIKKFKHEKVETCRLCKKEIYTDKQKWCVLIDYDCDERIGIGFYHILCLQDLIKGKVKVIEERWKEQLKGFVGNIFSRLRPVEDMN